MIVYRIVHKTVTRLLTGSGNESRWCSEGRKVIYASSSVSLACLENILRRSGLGFSEDFQTVFYELPKNTRIAAVAIQSLNTNWRLRNSYEYCQSIGNAWYDKKDSLVLKVPSAVIPDEYNYVIKTNAANIDRILIKEIKPFVPDERLENLLRGKG